MRVLGVGLLLTFAKVEGRGCVILECSEDVLLGTMVLSTCSRVVGRFVSRVWGRGAIEAIEVWPLSEGPIAQGLAGECDRTEKGLSLREAVVKYVRQPSNCWPMH